MPDGKFFKDETKDLIVKVGDKWIKLNPLGEIVDGPAIRILVNAVDKLGDKYIPDQYDTAINDAVTKVLEGDYDGASDDIATLENLLIDIPFTDEDTEAQIFKAANDFLLALLKDFIAKQKAKSQNA